MKSKEQNFTVAIRLRPVPPGQRSSHIKITKNSISIRNNRDYYSKEKKLNFDHVYSDETHNKTVFEGLIKSKLWMLRQNYNLSIMAYGATSSGKTYTIFGQGQKELGMVYIVFEQMMRMLQGQFWFSYIEIYNENINDLLQNDEHNVMIQEDSNGKVRLHPLKRIKIDSYKRLKQIILQGNQSRKNASNSINSVSSRSHAIMTLEYNSQNTRSTLTVIDLAGSEKVRYHGVSEIETQTIIKEGSNINKSLLALGNCIKSLEDNQSHIPYRDSKLTRILKDNLSGYSHNILIGCINPLFQQVEESINTLNYASKAAKIQRQLIQTNQQSFFQVTTGFLCQHCRQINDPAYVEDTLKYIINAKPQKTGMNLEQKLNSSIKNQALAVDCKNRERSKELKRSSSRKQDNSSSRQIRNSNGKQVVRSNSKQLKKSNSIPAIRPNSNQRSQSNSRQIRSSNCKQSDVSNRKKNKLMSANIADKCKKVLKQLKFQKNIRPQLTQIQQASKSTQLQNYQSLKYCTVNLQTKRQNQSIQVRKPKIFSIKQPSASYNNKSKDKLTKPTTVQINLQEMLSEKLGLQQHNKNKNYKHNIPKAYFSLLGQYAQIPINPTEPRRMKRDIIDQELCKTAKQKMLSKLEEAIRSTVKGTKRAPKAVEILISDFNID